MRCLKKTVSILRPFRHILPFILSLLIVGSCTTTRKRGEVSGFKKFYHNTTAEFNGFYNANVLYTESLAKLNAQHTDNYNQILDVYPYQNVENPAAVAGPLDEAIKKVSIVVNLHRVSHWTDDCYLLFGKSQYLKHNYEGAQEVFEYMDREFNPKNASKRVKRKPANAKERAEEKARKADERAAANKERKKAAEAKKKSREKELKAKKKAKAKAQKEKAKAKKQGKTATQKSKPDPKKKETASKDTSKDQEAENNKTNKEAPNELKPEDQKPDNYFLKHRPCYHEALVWLGRTYIEREMYGDAERIFRQVEEDPETPTDIEEMLAPAFAHYYIRLKRYDMALPYMQKATESEKDRQTKARYAYITAQLLLQLNNNQEATAYFDRARKFSNNYDLAFNAQMNTLVSAWANGSVSTADTERELERVMKDEKNKEYKDQIYLVYGNIALREKRNADAIKYYQACLSSQGNRKAVNAEAYYALAELYFTQKDYVKSKAYFDSTTTALLPSDERYKRAKALADNLTDIAANLAIINLQDSLLKIGQMPEADRIALAEKLLEEKDRKEREKLIAAANDPANQSTRSGSSSNYWLYNDRALRKGKKEFENVWGNRPLTDNWRHPKSNGNIATANDPATASTGTNITSTAGGAKRSETEIKELLKDVPTNPDAIKATAEKVEKAMYLLGGLYREKLQSPDLSIDVLEKRESRFAESMTYQPNCWYYLYLSYTELKNQPKAKYYYDKIVAKFPNSTYARVLQDPNYANLQKEEQKKLQQFYDGTYQAFEKGLYDQVVYRSYQADSLFKASNTLRPKFALLTAMSMGNMQGKETYITQLKDLIAKYNNTPEATRAREMLRLLDSQGNTQTVENTTAPKTTFIYEDAVQHFILVVVKDQSVTLNAAKNSVSDYNTQFNSRDGLNISNIYLGEKTDIPVLVIRKFESKEKAMRYIETVEKNKDKFLPANAAYEIYAVTMNNYREIIKQRSVTEYVEFWDKYYLLK